MQEYKHLGEHADELANGRPVGPGEILSLTAEEEKDPHNESLIERGILVSTTPDKGSAKKKEGGES